MFDLSTANWRKSTFSDVGGNCVEAALMADGVIIRHSKHPTAGTIAFSHPEWEGFLSDVRHGLTSNGVATITTIGTDTLVASLTTNVELRFDEGEWAAFLAGVAAGEFHLTGHPVA